MIWRGKGIVAKGKSDIRKEGKGNKAHLGPSITSEMNTLDRTAGPLLYSHHTWLTDDCLPRKAIVNNTLRSSHPIKHMDLCLDFIYELFNHGYTY